MSNVKKVMVPLLVLVLLLAFLPLSAAAEGESPVTTDQYTAEDWDPDTTVHHLVTSSDYNKVYTCPVRKNSVEIKFSKSEGPASAILKVEIKNADGQWEALEETKAVDLAHTVSFDLGGPYRYRVYAVSTAGDSGTCYFELDAEP